MPTCRPGRRTDRLPRALAALLAVLVLAAGCGPSGRDVEREVADLVDTAAQAAEAGDVAGLAGMISADYEDDRGRDRRAMGFLVRTLLGRYPDLLVVVNDLQVQPVSLELATARMTVVVLGRDGNRPLLAGLDADRLELSLGLRREDGEWRVTRAEWAPKGAGQ